MNIWSWVDALQRDLVDAGRTDLAEAIASFPDDVIEERFEAVRATTPVLIAAARTLDNPWLEVWTRHWATISTRHEGRADDALREAVELVEFSHRDEAAGCPQAVCAVQDLCWSYTDVDGVGFARERLHTAQESLSRIDPTWACYDCISLEVAAAQADLGDVAAAAETRLRAQDDMGRSGAPPTKNWGRTAVWLARSGRPDDGRRMIEGVSETLHRQPGFDGVEARLFAERTALVLALGGDLEGARAHLPAYPVDSHDAASPEWCDVRLLLSSIDPSLNTWHTGRVIEQRLEPRRRGGAHAVVVDTAATSVRLAALRGSRSTAVRHLRYFEEHRTQLRDGGRRLDELSRELHGLVDTLERVVDLPVPPADLLGWLSMRDDRDPERELDLLGAAVEAHPHDLDLVMALASAEIALGLLDDGLDRMERFAVAHPDDPDAANPLGFALLHHGRPDATRRIADAIAEHDLPTARWLLAHLAFENGDDEQVAHHCSALVDDDDSVANTRLLWANAEMRRGNTERVLELRLEALGRIEARGDDPSSVRWDILAPATILGRWDLVREHAERLGMTFSTDTGPVDEQWAWIRLRLTEPDGDVSVVSALRTGPVTAVVRSIAPPGRPQHAGDTYVFEAVPLEPVPEDPEERAMHQTLFRADHLLRRGDVVAHEFDGGYPGDDAWHRLVDEARSAGIMFWAYSGEQYVLMGPDGAVDAIYGMLAFDQARDPAEVHDILCRATSDWPVPLVWPHLAHAAGADLTEQLATITRYGIEIATPPTASG